MGWSRGDARGRASCISQTASRPSAAAECLPRLASRATCFCGARSGGNNELDLRKQRAGLEKTKNALARRKTTDCLAREGFPKGSHPETHNAQRPRRSRADFVTAPLSLRSSARLAQSAERKALNLVVVGSSPTVGVAWQSPATFDRAKRRASARGRTTTLGSKASRTFGRFPIAARLLSPSAEAKRGGGKV